MTGLELELEFQQLCASHLRKEVARLQAELELWKDRAEALERDFAVLEQAPCPHCGERP